MTPLEKTAVTLTNEARADLGLPPLPAATRGADEKDLTAKVEIGEYADLDLAHLKESAANVRRRFDPVAMKALTASIEAAGCVLSPLLVRELSDTEFEVVSGHRRLRAARALGHDTVPCNIVVLSDVQALEMQVVENVQRADLTPLEEADACVRLHVEASYTTKEIADRLGQSPSWAANRLRLGLAAPEVKAALEKGKIEYSVALALARLPTEAAQRKLLAEMVAGTDRGVSAQQLRDQLRESHGVKLDGKAFDESDKALLAEAGSCDACPFNSANDPADLFDQGRPPESICRQPKCHKTKAELAWDARSAKVAAKTKADVLPLSKSRNLFRFGELADGTPYVEANSIVFDDPKKRTWKQLMASLPADAQKPVVDLACKDGKPVELYHRAQVMARCADELNLKWAKKAVDGPAKKVAAKPKLDLAAEKAEIETKGRAIEALLTAIAVKVATDGLNGQSARALLRWVAYVGNHRDELAPLLKSWGWTGKGDPQTWLAKSADAKQLLAVALFTVLHEQLSSYQDETVRDAAKMFALDFDALLERAGA